MNFGTSWLTRMRISPILLLTGHRLPNMTFCGPARDTVLTNRQTEKLNFDTNYITILYVLRLYDILINRQRQLVEISHYTYSLCSNEAKNCKYIYLIREKVVKLCMKYSVKYL